MEVVTIRNYKKSDYLAVKEILIEGDLFVKTWDKQKSLDKRIEEKPDSIIVAIINQEVIGCVFLVDDIFPFIFHLAVKKEFRKKGIGKMLVQKSIEKLKKHGHKEIALFALDSDEEVRKWYQKQGFIETRPFRFIWKEI